MAEEQGGAARVQRMIDAGANPTDVQVWRENKRNAMLDAGAPQKDVDAYWGIKPPVDDLPMPKINSYIQAQFDMLDPANKQKVAESPYESFKAGLQMSASVLPFGSPTTTPNPEGGFVDNLAYVGGQVVGDIPASTVGGVAGYMVGGMFGAGAVSAALPEAIRAILVDQYEHPGGAASWGDVADRAAKVSWDVGLAAIAGGVGAQVGTMVGRYVGSQLNQAAGLAAGGIAGVVAGVGVQAGAEMRVPTKEDFAIAAVMMLGGTAGAKIVTISGSQFKLSRQGEVAVNNMRNLYRDTGIHPSDLIQLARNDAALQSEILAPKNAAGDRVTPGLDQVRPKEPEQYAPYKPKITNGQEKLVATDVALDPVLNLVGQLETGHIKSEATRSSVSSPAGAIGYYQIMPNTARQYGFDPAMLRDKQYNAQVSRTILADLSNRFNGDLEAILIGYNAGPGKAQQFLRSGRDYSTLPNETKGYLRNAERKGMLDRGVIQGQIETELKNQSIAYNAGPASAVRYNKAANIDPSWVGEQGFENVMVARKTASGQMIPDPEGVATYMQKFGRLANFKFTVGDEPFFTEAEYAKKGPQMIPIMREGSTRQEGMVWMPKADDVLVRRWYGLGNYEILHHEAGHAIDMHLNGGHYTKYIPKGTPLEAELLAASKQFKPKLWEKQPEYNATPQELMADAFAVWLSDPTMRVKMPEFARAYAERLKPYVEAANQALPVRDEGGKWQMPPEPETKAGAGGGDGGEPPARVPPRADGEEPRRQRKLEDQGPKLGEEELVAKLFDKIGAPGVRVGARLEWTDPSRWFPKLRAKMEENFHKLQSELAPARRLDNKLGHDPKAITLEDMARATYASRHYASYFMLEGAIDPITRVKVSDASYRKAYEQVAKDGGDQQGFVAYRMYSRAVEKARQGIDTNIDVREAQRFIDLPGVKAKYEKGAEIIQQSKDHLIDYGRDSGLWTPERAKAMKDLNRDHIVMKRIMDPTYVPPAPSREFGVRSAPQKMKGGSDRKFIDPMTAEWDNTQTIISLADRNRAINGMVNAIEAWKAKQPKQIDDKTQDPFWIERAPDEITKFGKGELHDEYGNVIPEARRAAFEPFMAMQNAWRHVKGDEMLFFREGKPMILKIKDKDMADLFRVVGRDEPEFIRWWTKIAGLERSGISMEPTYFLRSWSTGQFQKAIQGEEGVSRIPFRHMGKAIMETWQKGPQWDEWVRNGGMGGALADMDRNYAQHNLDKLFKATGDRHGTWNVFTNPYDAMATLGSKLRPIERMRQASIFMDQAARVADFMASKNAGQEPLKAAMTARKSQLDYSERLSMQWLDKYSRGVPFMTTGWKDGEQFMSAIANRPKTFFTAGAAIFTAPTVLNYAMNLIADAGKDENDPSRYHNRPQWQRDMYWVLPGGIKVPRGIGPASSLFGTTTERFLDYAFKQDPKGMADWAATVVEQAAPPMMPTIIQPALDQARNKTEMGQPLIPPRLEGASGWMQYNPNTTETSKKLSELLGEPNWNVADVSPAVIDNYIRQWSGNFPIKVLQAIEGWTGAADSGRPSSMADNLLVGWFFAREPLGGQAVNDYYEKRKDFTQAAKDKRLAMERQDLGELSQVDLARSEVRLTQVDKALAEQRKILNLIYADKDMDMDEKRKHVDTIARQMVSVSRQGLEMMRSYKAVGSQKVDFTGAAQ